MEELRENIYLFSAAKTYQQVSDMRDLLTGDDKISGWPEFSDAARAIYDQYNENWLRAEYDTAIGQGMMGARWMEIEKNKELLPILRYNATDDEALCEICGPLNGLTAEVDDPVWDTIYPENHFRCRCTVDQLDQFEEVSLTDDDDKNRRVSEVHEEMQEIFKMNAGKDRVVFSDDHPYFEVKKGDREHARNNFGLDIPETDE
jgi:SPP1 gp7 family putative phage head morphogenesis protein